MLIITINNYYTICRCALLNYRLNCGHVAMPFVDVCLFAMLFMVQGLDIQNYTYGCRSYRLFNSPRRVYQSKVYLLK